MIRFDIQDYCSLCFDFEPEVTKPVKEIFYNTDGKQPQTDTIVRCKYAKRCENIKRYLSHQIKPDETNPDEIIGQTSLY